MAALQQLADGSMVISTELQGIQALRAGGPKPLGGPGTGAASIPIFLGNVMKMGPYAGLVATTGGAIGAWTNNLGFDILVTRITVDVTTGSSGAANLSVGQTPTSVVTSSTNLLGATSVASIAVLGAAIQVKVKNGEFVTLTGSADTTGMVANMYLTYFPA